MGFVRPVRPGEDRRQRPFKPLDFLVSLSLDLNNRVHDTLNIAFISSIIPYSEAQQILT
jgi:hypothetical protein